MLTLKDVNIKYGRKKILENINLSFEKGTVTAVIGKNGSGKTTLLSAVAGLVKYDGQMTVQGKELTALPHKERARLLSLLPQTLPAPPITVEALAEMGRQPYLDLGQRLTAKDKETVSRAISDIGIEKLRNKQLDEISGGERQKAYLAMVLAQNTQVLLLDEPTTYLDAEYERELFSIIKRLKDERGKTVITVMHDLSSALEIADKVLLLNRGGVAFFGTSGECEKSGIIEESFGVQKYEYRDGSRVGYFYK